MWQNRELILVAGMVLSFGLPARAATLPDEVPNPKALVASFMTQSVNQNPPAVSVPPPNSPPMMNQQPAPIAQPKMHEFDSWKMRIGEPRFEICLGISNFWIAYRMVDMSPIDAAIMGLAAASYGGKVVGFQPLGVGVRIRYRFTPAIEGTLGYDDRGQILGLRVAL